MVAEIVNSYEDKVSLSRSSVVNTSPMDGIKMYNYNYTLTFITLIYIYLTFNFDIK